jgi:hypothetical protein
MSQFPFARQLLVLIVSGWVKRQIRAYARRLSCAQFVTTPSQNAQA